MADAGIARLELQDRLIARGHRIPIIFITGYPDENVRARAMKAGKSPASRTISLRLLRSLRAEMQRTLPDMMYQQTSLLAW